MLKKVLLTSVCSALLASSVYAANLNIAVVQVELIAHEIPQTKAMQERLEKEFGPREKKLVEKQKKFEKLVLDMQKNKPKGKALEKAQKQAAELNQELQIEGRKYQEDRQFRTIEERNKLFSMIQDKVNDVAKEGKYDMVLKSEAIAYLDNNANKKVNITNEVIKRLKK